MRLRLGVPSDLTAAETAAALDAALEASTRTSEPLIARGKIPTFARALKQQGIRWRPEPPGEEHFDGPRTVMRRKWGDCDDLAPWHAASLRATGQDPYAQAVVKKSGPGRWHAVVVRGDGDEEDPSIAAGMRSGVSGYGNLDGAYPATWAPMFQDRMALAAYPYRGGWAGRVDLPDQSNPMSWSAVHGAATPSIAVCGAIHGARVVGLCAGDIDPYDDIRLSGLHDLLMGVDPREVDAALEQEGCVGFLPFLAPAAMSLAAPLISKILPGGGGGGGAAPPAAAPPPAAAMAPSGGGGMGPGTTVHVPGGPIIVRF